MWNQTPHTYEELREVMMDVILGKERVPFPPDQWAHLTDGVKHVLASRAGVLPNDQQYRFNLHYDDRELLRDIFWDLFRQGYITLGVDNSNAAWPFFRLSEFGKKALQSQSPYRFHDTTSFIGMVRTKVPDLSPGAEMYLNEAVTAFYTGCMLASCVMIGVAAEAEFLRLLDTIATGKYAKVFALAQKPFFIRKKIASFDLALGSIISQLPADATQDLETNLTMIQSVLRIARNDAGHPSGASPEREQVYVFLQLFVPYARQLMLLRKVLV
jgi:hypothetical protein